MNIAILVSALSVLGCTYQSSAAAPSSSVGLLEKSTKPTPRDQGPSIEQKVAAMIQKIDEKELRRTIDDLVGFGTRHVLSATDSPTRGTGAARAYLEKRYRELIPLSAGRLTVEREEYDVSANRRSVPDGLKVVNIVATLRGTTDPDRVYIVGGHYDSRNSRGSDGEGDAPGANDQCMADICTIHCPEKRFDLLTSLARGQGHTRMLCHNYAVVEVVAVL